MVYSKPKNSSSGAEVKAPERMSKTKREKRNRKERGRNSLMTKGLTTLRGRKQISNRYIAVNSWKKKS